MSRGWMGRQITIDWVANGWTAKVGCQTLVYTDARVLVDALLQYLTDPETMEKDVLEHAINIKYTSGGTPVCGPLLGAYVSGIAIQGDTGSSAQTEYQSIPR